MSKAKSTEDRNVIAFESFSRTASDLIRLRLALYGPEDAQALIRRCYRRSKAEHINERTVQAAWAELDQVLNAVYEGQEQTPAERDAYLDTKAAEMLASARKGR